MAGHYYNGRELELLIPASSLEVLKIAVIFGADAVYIGGEAFDDLQMVKHENALTEEDIRSALEAYDKEYFLYRTV